MHMYVHNNVHTYVGMAIIISGHLKLPILNVKSWWF